jgi:hypothetical protein
VTHHPLQTAALALAIALAIATPTAQAQAQVPAGITVGAAPDAPDWIRPNQPARFALSRPLTVDDGRLAVLVGDTDWTSLAESTGAFVSLRPAGVRFPTGEHAVTFYVVNAANQWQPIGQTTLRVLTEGGFEKSVAKPSVEVGLTGQAALERTPAQPPTDRDTFQDFSLRAGIETTHVRNGWTTTTQAQMVGVDYAPQALRFSTLGEEAPLVDLGSYQVGIRNNTVSFTAGHTTVGTHRMLLNTFQTRGVSGSVRLGSVVDVSASAANGSTIVGYDNLLGLGDSEHRVVNAAVGLELIPARRGALRVEGLVMNGSVQPLTNVNQGAVRDPEESVGLGLQVRATDARARFVLDGGLSRSRFTNPLDPQAPQGLAIVPVRETTRDARYLDLSYAFLQGATLGETATANLTTAFRYSRVDPLYRSVALPVRADLEQSAIDVTTALGAFTSQATFDVSRDNLAEIGSILTTRSRQFMWTNALPLQTFAGASASAAAWPTLTYALTRMHQFGDALPDGGLFDSASQVPDQVSLNQTLGVTWQGAVWRGGYAWNRSLQDNRQPGRERADLLNVIHTFTVGAMASTKLDAGVEFAFEDADNQEISRTDLTRRVSVNVTARPFTRTSIAAVLTRNHLEDEPSTSERRTTDVNLTFTQDVSFLRAHPDRLRAQFFVRYVRQTIYGLLLGMASPDDTQFWTLNTGLTFRIF